MTINAEGTLDDLYLEWLYNKIAAVGNRNPERSYWSLARQLYSKPFRGSVHNDDNRAADGQELRLRFLGETGIEMDIHWVNLECSMLEMLIALSERVAFQAEHEPIEWFWHFLANIEISRYNDYIYEISIQEEVEEAINRVIYRTYSDHGVGGLFPLRYTDHDQRKVELWYQMSAYLLEGLYATRMPHVV